MDRDAQFQRIKAYFDEKDKQLALAGKLPLGSTEKGFWGTAHLDDCYALFQRIELQNAQSFLDLGSGDGRVVLVAALFTKATGIEYDRKLHEQAVAAAHALGIDATLLCADYTLHDLSGHDVWFSYADHNFSWLEAKQDELTILYLYHDTYHPEFLAKDKTEWLGQIPVFRYTRKQPTRKK